MSEALTDTTDSTEIEIKLDANVSDSAADSPLDDKQSLRVGTTLARSDANVPSTSESTPKSFQTVEPKHIANLTDDERATIIASVRNGVEQPYYDVKFYKNGNTRIIKRKLKQPSTAEQVINSQPLPATTEAKRYYTDNQLLFEHIIELNAKVDRLTAKHKKLKKKYTTIRNDIYADEDDIVEPSPLPQFEDTPSNCTSANVEDETTDSPSTITTEPTLHTLSQTPPKPPSRFNWRSQVKYL